MDPIVEKLQRQAHNANLEIDRADVFEMLAWCPICCRDGGRGGNGSCGPKPVLEE